jgi:hypothetical protein
VQQTTQYEGKGGESWGVKFEHMHNLHISVAALYVSALNSLT